MKIGLASLLFKRMPLEAAFEAAAKYGYDGVEINGIRPHAFPFDVDSQLINKVLELEKKYNLEVPMFTPDALTYPYNLASSDKKEQCETLDLFKRSVDFAGSIGTSMVLCSCGHGGFGKTKEENLNRVADMIWQIAEYAKGTTVRLVLEAVTVMESNAVVYLDDLLKVLKMVGKDNVVAMLDNATPWVHWEPFSLHFEMLAEKLQYIHFIDNDGRDMHHFPVGEGNIPMEALVMTIRRHGYDGWLTNEMISPYMSDPEYYAAREIKKIKKLLEIEEVSV